MNSIRNTIKNYLDEDIAPFSMPGHKYGRAFKENNLYDNITKLMINGDLTEVDGLDNLHDPSGVIKEALDDLKNLYKSKKSYFLVNGSTSGNLAMIFAAFSEGDKVLIERGCHRSIFNGIILRKLRPVYLDYNYDSVLGLPISNNSVDVISRIENEEDIKGIVLTYPNYYGICCDLKAISEKCKEKNILLIVDSAHGAHFGFSGVLPQNAVSLGGDIVVESAHKTLPSLTQTAYLHVMNENLIDNTDFYVSAFSSTSPSYMFMMSLEYSKDFLKSEVELKYKKLIHRIEKLKQEISSCSFLRIIDKEYINKSADFPIFDYDNTRIVINVDKGLSGHKLLKYLRENSVQCEMSDERNVVLIPTPFNIEEDYDKLIKALKKCSESDISDKLKEICYMNSYEKVIEPYEASCAEKILVNIEDCEGMTAGDNIVPYPPGIPLVVMGEKITRNHIETIKRLLSSGVDVLGVNENKIKAVK